MNKPQTNIPDQPGSKSDRQKNDPQEVVERFQDLYHNLNRDTCDTGIIEAVYDLDLLFEDSFHRLESRQQFIDYCESLYENVQSISFDFHDAWISDNDAMLTWTMRYRHPRIKGGAEVSIEGSSLIRFNNKVYYHRDYFDGGEMLYENLPILGRLIKQLKKRMA